MRITVRISCWQDAVSFPGTRACTEAERESPYMRISDFACLGFQDEFKNTLKIVCAEPDASRDHSVLPVRRACMQIDRSMDRCRRWGVSIYGGAL